MFVLEEEEMFFTLCLKVLSPFYIFQLFSCTSWFADEYVTYASCIVFITVISVILTLREVRKVTLTQAYSQLSTFDWGFRMNELCEILFINRK